ncbi:hypothetical protein [Streptomyces capoamus]|uniref:hypothetical protein n=1 Tax=Streptomyces capoamus TaxID=68183 RepID=UPI0016766F96|nr:hypothetical protein [Streptomyces capoamus]
MVSAAVVLITFATVAGCGGAGRSGSKVTLDEQEATRRAEEIIHQAVDGMSPEPTLERVPLAPIGACLADEHSSGERVQVQLTYRLSGVPGSAAKQLVRQARDAWVKRGYAFQSSDADWNDPYPTVSMRTERDDFWMDAITGVMDKEKGTGVASLGVTSPCFRPGDASALRAGRPPLAPPDAPPV